MADIKTNDILGKVFFGKFLATKKIGQGSFGQVFEGTNNLTNEKVAMKFVILNK